MTKLPDTVVTATRTYGFQKCLDPTMKGNNAVLHRPCFTLLDLSQCDVSEVNR
ncbi:hypothetical protein KIN20_026845 [Parelaphostrongylus tenuis]|uniref:Uncharacterized protein n=1 Tax=Parelaphostrongylus tenuis TaxID=148309 RepID=A0AAD5QYI8_PARTN|nr:hypothetical protein KIN20_026845 [Parelaphostrongylus tenuis]